MPIMLPPEATRFEVRDGAPILTLATETPAEIGTGEWSILNRTALVVIDGPGDPGFPLPRLTTGGEAAPQGCDEAVDRADGSADAPAPFARSVG